MPKDIDVKKLVVDVHRHLRDHGMTQNEFAELVGYGDAENPSEKRGGTMMRNLRVGIRPSSQLLVSITHELRRPVERYVVDRKE